MNTLDWFFMWAVGGLLYCLAFLREIKGKAGLLTAITGIAGILLLVLGTLGMIWHIPNPYLRGVALAAAVIAGCAFLVLMWREEKARREYDRQMTNLFNSIPPDQRYGYTEDFPKDTRWDL